MNHGQRHASHWLYSNDGKIVSALKKCRRLLASWAGKKFGIDLYRYGTAQYKKMTGQTVANYDSMWQKIIEAKPMRSNSIPGAFVKWDNTPRHGERGQINVGTPEKFKYYLSKQIKHAREDYHEDMIFMYAWNEWAEGGYLEPDEDDKYESLVDATNFVKTVEQHQHRKIACLEEIAYLNGWISKDELMEVYEVMKKNQYGQYLKDVMDGKYQEHLY